MDWLHWHFNYQWIEVSQHTCMMINYFHMMLFCKQTHSQLHYYCYIRWVNFVNKNVFELYLIKYIKYRDQIQIREIQIQIRKYKYVFDPIPAGVYIK